MPAYAEEPSRTPAGQSGHRTAACCLQMTPAEGSDFLHFRLLFQKCRPLRFLNCLLTML